MDAISAIMQNSLTGIHTTFPAKVIKFDENKKSCTLQPLYQTVITETQEKVDYPQLVNVPVLSWRMKFKITLEETTEHTEEMSLILNSGDIVLCTCSEKSIDSITQGLVHSPVSKRKFDLTDALVIGIIPT